MLKIQISALALCLLATDALAGVVATQTVEKEVVTRDASGTDRIERVTADTVAPGDEVIYTLQYKNDAPDPAENIVLVMPVPQEVSYVEGSIFGEQTVVTFSADGGQTYVARGRLTIAEDGLERNAKSNDITHIKWTLSDSLPANAQGEVSYRAVLN